MLAGYYSREAAAIYLGVKATAMIAAIVGIVMLLPWRSASTAAWGRSSAAPSSRWWRS